MTPAALAELYGRAEPRGRHWSAAEFADLLADPAAIFVSCDHGFAIGRVTLDEAELFLIATAPEARRQGIGRRMLQGFVSLAAERGATSVFLEVAASNQPALALYSDEGFVPVARRKSYYSFPDGTREDAVICQRMLPNGQF